MEASYIETCGVFRDFLDRGERHAYGKDVYEPDAYPELLSLEMWLHFDQCLEAVTYRDYVQYRDYALDWLDQNLENFRWQIFWADDLQDWTESLKLNSAFRFGPMSELTSEQRLEHVRSVVEKCGGNKSEAARVLKISRQRVDQLLKTGERDKGKPLRSFAQGPFAGLGS